MVRNRKLLLIGWFIGVILFIFILQNAQFLAGDVQAQSLTPFGHRGSWDLIFSDTFDSQTIDPNKWLTCDRPVVHGCAGKGENEFQRYLSSNVFVVDGLLRLAAAGMITTDRENPDPNVPPRFAFKYGYVEVRARIPKGNGLRPAIWLLPADHALRLSIDLMEIQGARTDTLNLNLGYANPDGSERRVAGQWISDTDLSLDWHTYAVDWKPDSVTWYVDGLERQRITDLAQIPTAPMVLLLNFAVKGSLPGSPDSVSVFPGTFEIDYVHVWKRGGEVVISPVADTFVARMLRNRNYGLARQLAVDGNPKQTTFLKYDLSALRGKQIQSVWLRIKTTAHPSAGSINTQYVQIVPDNDWNEKKLAFSDNLLIDNQSIGFLAETVPDVFYDIPLDSRAVQNRAGKILSIAIQSDNFDGLFFYSRELPSMGPRLFVNFVDDRASTLMEDWTAAPGKTGTILDAATGTGVLGNLTFIELNQ
jgi:beta-glucanase (GH16 family)